MTRTSVENSTDVFCYPSSLVGPNRQIRACTKICLLDSMKGAPLHEQKELRSCGKHRRCEFANGAGERAGRVNVAPRGSHCVGMEGCRFCDPTVRIVFCTGPYLFLYSVHSE